MLQSLVVLMFFQFLGELLVHATGLPLPGPVCGMLFLLAWLRGGWTLPVELTAVATGLLDHFGLLFVPAGVSIIGFGALIMRDGPAIVLALVLSIAATVAITACVFGGPPAEYPMIESAKLAGLLQGPLVWLLATLAIYAAATALWRRHGKAPILNPTMLSIIAIGAVLLLSGVSYPAYLDGVVILNYVLGTAVVALAVPLHRHIHLLQGRTLKLVAALFVGSTTSLVLGLIVAKAAGASLETILSIAPKAATAAVSIEIARGIGGLPGLTAVVTIMTGITTAVVGPYVLDLLGVRAPETRGLALGVSGHGIATARAFSESEVAGSFASIGTALNASLTAALVPLAVWALGLT